MSDEASAIQQYMGGCQNYGSFLGTLNIRCRIIIGIQKRTINLTTTHMRSGSSTKKTQALDVGNSFPRKSP